MSYVDGFLAAVPNENKQAFLDHARQAADFFKELGALHVVECWGEDVPEGTVTSFPMAVQCKEDETVVFSWIVWPSKDVRNAAHGRMMSDPRFDPAINPMPFDGKRMIFGGFEPILEA